MNRVDIQNTIVKLYDEYNPNQVDNDIYMYIDGFIDMYVSSYLSFIPNEMLSPITLELDNVLYPILNENIGYNGGIINLPSSFSKLISFKYYDWKTTLYTEDVISSSHPRRKLQDNKYTAGGLCKPVVSIELINGDKSICFWGYNNKKELYQCTYLPECNSLLDISNAGTIKLDDWVMLGYCYYVLSNIFDSISEGDKAEKLKQKLQELLVSKSIIPQQPIAFSNNNNKK